MSYITSVQQHDTSPHITSAMVFIRRRQFAEASIELNFALANNRDASIVWTLLGIVAREQHNYKEAIPCFERAIELAQSAQEKSSYLFHLAYAQAPSQDISGAVSSLKSAFQLHPTFVNGWAFVLMFLRKNKLLSCILFCSCFYSMLRLPLVYAILPAILLIASFLATIIFDVKIANRQNVIAGAVWVVLLLLLLYFRIAYFMQ